MMARALGVGIETWPCCEDAEPMGVVESGTSPSQPSSCCDRSCLLSVYQEPAWVALRVTILGFRNASIERNVLVQTLETGIVMLYGVVGVGVRGGGVGELHPSYDRRNAFGSNHRPLGKCAGTF
jgi:hypothetical protein